MRRLVFLLMLAVLLAGVAPAPAQAQSRDEEAIRALIDRAFQADSSVDEKVAKQILGDHSSSAGPFFPPFVASLASVAEVEQLVGKALADLSARKVSATSPINVHVDKNLAWAALTWRADMTFKDGTRRSFDGRSTVTFVREGKNWKFAHWHDSLPAPFPLSAAALQGEADAVLQVERNAWEAAKNKQLDALVDYFAEDASVFGGGQAYRLRGKADIMRDVEAWIKQTDLRSYQMLDPEVKVLGDTALLTYYFTESGVRDGKDFSNAGKMTMVFVKQGGKWRVLHEHESVNR
jgi:ketosteroid isomerase-like protein